MRDFADQERRRRHYAQCATALIRRPGAGRESVFAQALNNALAAIVTDEKPEALVTGAGKVRSARELLRILGDLGERMDDGAVRLPIRDWNPDLQAHVDQRIGPTDDLDPGYMRIDLPALIEA